MSQWKLVQPIARMHVENDIALSGNTCKKLKDGMLVAAHDTKITNTANEAIPIIAAEGIAMVPAHSEETLLLALAAVVAPDLKFYASEIVDDEAVSCFLSKVQIWAHFDAGVTFDAGESYILVWWSSNDVSDTVSSATTTIHHVLPITEGTLQYNFGTDIYSRGSAKVYNHLSVFGPVAYEDLGDPSAWSAADRAELLTLAIQAHGANITTTVPS